MLNFFSIEKLVQLFVTQTEQKHLNFGNLKKEYVLKSSPETDENSPVPDVILHNHVKSVVWIPNTRINICLCNSNQIGHLDAFNIFFQFWDVKLEGIFCKFLTVALIQKSYFFQHLENLACDL